MPNTHQVYPTAYDDGQQWAAARNSGPPQGYRMPPQQHPGGGGGGFYPPAQPHQQYYPQQPYAAPPAHSHAYSEPVYRQPPPQGHYQQAPPQQQHYKQPQGYPAGPNPYIQRTAQENQDGIYPAPLPQQQGRGGPPAGGNPKYEMEPAPRAENIYNRKCRDVIWLIIFLIMFAAMCAVGYYSIRYGNVDRLIYGRDSEGNLCGAPNGTDSSRDLRGQTDLVYFLNDNDYRRCVDGCPSVTADYNTVICKYDVVIAASVSDRAAQIQSGDCSLTIESKAVLNRCIPLQLLSDIQTAANASLHNQTYTASGYSFEFARLFSAELDARDAATAIFQDLAQNWWVILVCVGGSFVLAFLYMLLLQWFASLMVWGSIFVVLGVAWALGFYFIYNYVRIKVLHQNMLSVGFSQIDSVLYNEKLLLVLGCITGGIALILTLVILCLGRRIRLATKIVKEASAALRAMPFIVFFPFLKYTVILIWMAVFVAVMALLATSGTEITTAVEGDVNDQLSKTGKKYENQPTLQYLQIYFTFGFLWVYNWIIAIGQTTIAGSIATWYWARDKKNLPSFPVIRALGRTFRYHLGSLALGSLLIAIVQLIRLVIFEMQRRLKGTGNKAAQYLLCCLQCCFKCIEAILKMLTKNAYVEIAVYGYSFCTAARMAMQLIAANIVRMVVVHKVGTFLIFVGKLCIVLITTLGGLGLLVHLEGKDQVFANYAVPLIFIIIFSYLTASAFLSTFSMAITTIFLSFCEDSQRNDGSRERPYYMSKNLEKFVDKHAHDKPMV
ncbi:plasma-membrane choline transporter-domain-containing protein [Fimicolochytrium jonesii]|uniref:plasma-membrane choline transporter-domain-containing protein n=1 Tax=Fimicolochytrium jonesii TaxID=1396493 RepID=UPI0022FE729F|nr:plasma-membrane choline transporter-domain-containing protein [Fimicolochytrium jonesii]KAI8824855.1 plasma-membrane choline transporter-domain-containing protein [Fimicolochytrium jonesii]